MSKVLLIGWDAADWKVINPLMDQGKMPALSRLVETGVKGNIATLHPVLSPMLWTSIATGKRPYKHGIYGFYEPTADGMNIHPVTNLSRSTKAVWNILNQNGKRSNVVGWWPSHPAEPINGVMVSDMFHKNQIEKGIPAEVADGAVHPQSMAEELKELRVSMSELTGAELRAFIPKAQEVNQEKEPRLAQCAKIVAECSTIQAVATHLLETTEWDFTAVYFDAIDHFSHAFMKFHPPRREFVDEREFELYKDVVAAGYIFHDMMLSRLVELAGEDTTVILLSDHGFHPDHLRPDYVPHEPAGPAIEHRDLGIFVINGPNVKKDQLVFGTSLLDITPTVLTLFDLPVGEDMDGRVVSEAFEQTPETKYVASWDEIDGEDGCHEKDKQLNPFEAEEAMQQLVDLGYIEELHGDNKVNVKNAVRELNFNLARSYMDAGLFGEAIPLLTELYDEHQSEYRFGLQLAMCYKSMGRIEDLDEIVEHLSKRRIYDARSAQKKLIEFQKIGMQRRQEKDAEQAGSQEPEAGEAEKQNGSNTAAHPGTKDKVFSEKELKEISKHRAIAMVNHYTLDFLKGFVLLAKGKAKDAIAFLQKAIDAQPRKPGLFIQIGEAYLILNEWDEAHLAFQKAMELDENNPNVLLGMAQVHLGKKENGKAAEYALDAIARTYFLPNAHNALGIALSRMGKTDKAIQAFETAIEQNPNFSQAYKQLSMIYENQIHDPGLAKKYKDLSQQATENEQQQRSVRGKVPIRPIEDVEEQPEDKVEIKRVPTIRRKPASKTVKPISEIDPEKSIVVVTGVPRSGTSLMMQMLDAGGMKTFTDSVRIADEDNPKGYLEYEKTKSLQTDNTWLHEGEGHAIKVVCQLIEFLPAEIDYKIIFMHRDLDEVIQSQHQMLDRNDAAGGNLDDDRLRVIYQQQIESTAKLLQNKGIPAIRVPYKTAIEKPGEVAKRVAEFLAVDMDVDKMAEVVDPELYRNRVDQLQANRES